MNRYSVELRQTKTTEFIVEANNVKEAEEIVENVILLNNLIQYVELINKQTNTFTIRGKRVNRWWAS